MMKIMFVIVVVAVGQTLVDLSDCDLRGHLSASIGIAHAWLRFASTHNSSGITANKTRPSHGAGWRHRVDWIASKKTTTQRVIPGPAYGEQPEFQPPIRQKADGFEANGARGKQGRANRSMCARKDLGHGRPHYECSRKKRATK